MNPLKFALSLLVLISVMPAVYANDKPDIDHLAMYRSYAGAWESVTKVRMKGVDEPLEMKGKWIQRDILDGRMIQLQGENTTDGKVVSYMWLYTYDMREKAYVGWLHDEEGFNLKLYGKWSDEDKKMTWTIKDPEEWGIRFTIVDDLTDPDQLRISIKIESIEGELLLEQSITTVRAKEE